MDGFPREPSIFYKICSLPFRSPAEKRKISVKPSIHGGKDEYLSNICSVSCIKYKKSGCVLCCAKAANERKASVKKRFQQVNGVTQSPSFFCFLGNLSVVWGFFCVGNAKLFCWIENKRNLPCFSLYPMKQAIRRERLVQK